MRKIEDNVVITDCRFKNEVDAIKNAGGTLSLGGGSSRWDASLDSVNFRTLTSASRGCSGSSGPCTG